MAHALFITGTDTDIGKTMVTACLAKGGLEAGKRVAIFKPVQTGVTDDTQGDAAWCAKHLNTPEGLHVETLYCFEPPVAPTVADGDGIISLNAITERFNALCQQFDMVLLEGAGGVLCPLTPQTTMADLARHLNIPAILVSRRTLGTINHTLCAVEALHRRGVAIQTILLHDASPLSQEVEASLSVRSLMPELTHWLKTITTGEAVPPIDFLPYLESPIAKSYPLTD
jgi:dethiobiotin synthetase